MQYNINTIVYDRYKDTVPLHPLTASWQCQPRMSCSAEPASAPGTLPAAVGTPPPSEREGEPYTVRKASGPVQHGTRQTHTS